MGIAKQVVSFGVMLKELDFHAESLGNSCDHSLGPKRRDRLLMNLVAAARDDLQIGTSAWGCKTHFAVIAA